MERAEDQLQPFLVAKIDKAYCFRHVISAISQICAEANLIFTRDGIFLEQINAQDDGVVKFSIYAENLTEYRFNPPEDEDGNSVEIISIGIRLPEFARKTKPLLKKDSLWLFLSVDHNGQTNFWIQPEPNDQVKREQRASLNPVEIHEIQQIDLEDIVYHSTPNLSPLSSEFSKACSDINAQKSSYVKISIFTNGLLMTGMKPGGKIGIIEGMGEYSLTSSQGKEISEIAQLEAKLKTVTTATTPKKTPKFHLKTIEEIGVIKVRSQIIKAMSKIHNLTVKDGKSDLYYEKDRPLLISTPIENYGVLNIYLLNNAKL